MNIIPISLHLKNFLSYKDQIFLFKKGSNLVLGHNFDDLQLPSNGAGKSTIGEALLYAFEGRTLKGLKADDVIREGQKSCFVKFIFKADNEMGILKVTRNPNDIYFKVGNYVAKSFSFDEKRKMVKEWFGFDFDILTKFIIVGESEKNKFSFLSSDDFEMKNILTKLTMAEPIDLALKEVKEKLDELEVKKVILQRDIQKERENVFETEKEIKDTNFRIEKLFLKKKNNFKINILEKKIKKVKKVIDQNTVLFAKNKKEMEKFVLQKEEAIDKLKEELYQNNINQAHYSKNKNKYKFLLDKIIICPKCKTDIYLDKENKLDRKQLLDKVEYFDDLLNKKENEKILLENKLIKEKNFKSSALYNSFVKKQNFFVEVLEVNKEILNKNENLLKQNLIQLESEIKFLKENKEKQKLKLKEKQNNLLKLEKQNKDIIKLYNLYNKYVFYFGKEGFKNYLFGKKLKLIEFTVNEILKETGALLKVELFGMKKLKSGKYRQKIEGFVYLNGKKRKFNSLSKGEARRIDLAFILAFGKLLSFKNNFCLRIFDEPFGGLDNKGIQNIIMMLKNYNITNYIFSPDSNLKNYFNEENIITVYKKNGISYLKN